MGFGILHRILLVSDPPWGPGQNAPVAPPVGGPGTDSKHSILHNYTVKSQRCLLRGPHSTRNDCLAAYIP